MSSVFFVNQGVGCKVFLATYAFVLSLFDEYRRKTAIFVV